MNFNSLNFGIFIIVLFILFWFVINKSVKYQNILLLVASYFFYSLWDWRFIFILLFSTILDFYIGALIYSNSSKKLKLFYLYASILINLGILSFFKYYNFFINSFIESLTLFGYKGDFKTLEIILPIGISFYTFHGLSYVIDIYRNKVTPEKSFINYSLFVSFFPLLVAGPIERATHLLPQIRKNKEFIYLKFVDGLKQILWGFFKKIVIADNCAFFVNLVFNNSHNYNGSAHLLSALLFSFQIYCDFSGYSDIALGTARLFGIELFRNFSFPYFSKNIAEFWRRWHISLSSWFKDYLYIPLGGSNVSSIYKIRNILLIFVVSGFWHGANYTFIIWGLLNALFVMPYMFINKSKHDLIENPNIISNIINFLKIFSTFLLVTLIWIFFRANNLSDALEYITTIFSKSLFTYPNLENLIDLLPIGLMILFFIYVEWNGRFNNYAIENTCKKKSSIFRYSFYYIILFLIIYFGGNEQQFIYFQF